MEANTRPFLYRFLPPEVRAFFLERGWEDLELLRERYGLAPQAVEVLDELQQEILFGYEPMDKLENLIRTRLKYDPVLTRRVAMDMVELRFLPLDAYLNAAPYRLYVEMGGNTTVLHIASVPHGGITASIVREAQDAFLEELWEADVKRRKEAVVEKQDQETQEGDAQEQESEAVSPPHMQEEAVEQVVLHDADTQMAQVHEEANEESDDAALHTPEEHAQVLPMREPPMEIAVVADTQEQVSAVKHADAAMDAAEPQANTTNTVEEKPSAKAVLDAMFAGDVANADPLGALKSGKTVGVAEHPGVQVIRDACGVEGMSADREKRFRVLLGSRLSGVRTHEALLAALMKPVEQGGMGFESAVAMRIGSLIATELTNTHRASTEKATQEKQAFVAARQAVWNTTGEGVKTDSSLRGAGATKQSLAASALMLNMAPAPVSRSNENDTQPPSNTPAPRAVTTKVPMVDISVPPNRKLAGPVEEFGAMTLANFRRMPGGTSGAVQSLEEQITRMNQTDPALGMRAMAAWAQSPLTMEYRRLLGRALQLAMPLERLLRDAAENPQGFSLAEVQALRVFHAAMRTKGG